MNTASLQNPHKNTRHCRFAGAVVAVLAALTLAACGGGGGGGSSAKTFSTPADARAYAYELTFALGGSGVSGFDLRDTSASDLPTCSSGGSRTDDGPQSVDSPYASGGSLSAEQYSFDHCMNSAGNTFNGMATVGSDSGVHYVRFGSAAGDAPFRVSSEGSSGTLTQSVTVVVNACDSCRMLAGVAAGALQSTLLLKLEKKDASGASLGTLTLREGSDSAPRTLRFKTDYPSSGQTSFLLDGGGYELTFDNGAGASCDLPVDYTTPDATQQLVTDGSGGFVSGRVRIAAPDGSTAQLDFDSAGATITVDGVSQTYTGSQLKNAFDARCPGLSGFSD